MVRWVGIPCYLYSPVLLVWYVVGATLYDGTVVRYGGTVRLYGTMVQYGGRHSLRSVHYKLVRYSGKVVGNGMVVRGT